MAFGKNIAFMGGYNLLNKGKPQSGALAPLFGCEKRIENLLQNLIGHTAAVVGDIQPDILPPVPRDRRQAVLFKLPSLRGAAAYLDCPFLMSDCMDCVNADIENDLIHLRLISEETFL